MEKILGKLTTTCRDSYVIVAVGSAGTLLLGLLFYFCLHKPLAAGAADYARQAAQSASKVTQITNFQNAHLNFKEYQAEIDKREKRVRSFLPEDIGQGVFIISVERLALKNEMQLEMVSPQKLMTDTDKICLPLKVKLTGSYFGLLKFLQGLQNGERLVEVEDMSVTVKGDSLMVDMLLNIYAVPAK